jgi:hypothetical protein
MTVMKTYRVRISIETNEGMKQLRVRVTMLIYATNVLFLTI